MTVRVGVIGARRTRNGTGPYVAAQLVRAGARVPAVATSSRGSAAIAVSELAEQGVACAPFATADELLAEADIDAVAICSPLETHVRYLRLALERGLHVFCEKPVAYWADQTSVKEVEHLVTGFSERGLAIHVNAQWPYTLQDFLLLHGLDRLPRVRSLRVELAPPRTGASMLPEALPHVLSLLTATCPVVSEVRHVTYERSVAYDRTTASKPSVSQERSDAYECSKAREHTVAGECPDAYERSGADESAAVCVCSGDSGGLEEGLTVGFVASGPGTAPVDVTCVLRPCPDQPRPAAYEINGMRVERVVDMRRGYQMSLHSAGRWRRLADPLAASVEDFLAKVAGQRPVAYRTIVVNESLGAQLMRSFPPEPAISDRREKEEKHDQERARLRC